jgi:hypothetical protein
MTCISYELGPFEQEAGVETRLAVRALSCAEPHGGPSLDKHDDKLKGRRRAPQLLYTT